MALVNANAISNVFGANALISGSSFGDVTANVKISEAHQYEAEVTETPLENGSIVSDHVITAPIRATLNFEMTNGSFGLLSATQAQDVFETLSEIVENRELVTLTTEHAIYDNMIIKSFTPLHRAPYKGALQIAVTLQQINFVTLETTSVQANGTTSGNLNTALSSTVDNGKASATYTSEVTSSVLSDFKSSLLGG